MILALYSIVFTCYTGLAVSYAVKGNWGGVVVFAAYAISLIGLKMMGRL